MLSAGILLRRIRRPHPDPLLRKERVYKGKCTNFRVWWIFEEEINFKQKKAIPNGMAFLLGKNEFYFTSIIFLICEKLPLCSL